MSQSAVNRALITGDTVGGVWTFVIDLARELSRCGVEVMLATMGNVPSADQKAQAAAIPNLRHEWRNYKLEWMSDPWSDVQAAGEWLLQLESEFQPDVVHLNTLVHGALPFKARTIVTVHSCVVSWWEAVKATPLPSLWDRYVHEVKRSLRAADVVTAPTQAMLDAAIRIYSIDRKKARAVHNGRSSDGFYVDAKSGFFLGSGRLWDEAKNISLLVNAAAELQWDVYLAGHVDHTDGQPLASCGCHTLGHLSSSELASWYARADVFIAPSLYEPFGYSALEAAYSGCALILGDIPSQREVWGRAALYVDPHDVDHLAHTARRLAEDPIQTKLFGTRAFAHARRYSPERMCRQYLDLYAAAAQWRTLCAS